MNIGVYSIMTINKSLMVSLEFERISNYIANWLYSNEEFLNVITVPHNSASIFIKAINSYINAGKRVLYITNEREEYVDILSSMRKHISSQNYSYIRNYKIETEKSLIVCNFKNALKIDNKFDLVIYDDIRSLPVYSKYEIIDIMAKNCKERGKFIAFSIESIFKNKREILLPIYESRMPIIEPRIISTKIDLSNDIPYMIYDYLRWSIEYGKKVIIYVPDKEKLINVLGYLSAYFKDLNRSLLYFSKESEELKIIFNFMKMKRGILITDDFKEKTYFITEDKSINEMVFFANHCIFDYKKLVYFCEKTTSAKKNIMREVIFLGNAETQDMYKAKNIIRSFNREAWEKGLLKI
jgi:late competence protein required for DNA uptake (superfamily II DNA/RNA helicase)